MTAPASLLIAGAGMAGLTAALCAFKAGLTPRVFERAGQLSEVGAGLQLGPNAMKVLRGLGLEDAVRAAGHEPGSLDLRDGSDGTRIFSVPAGPAAQSRWGAPYVVIERAALQSILKAALEARAPGCLTLGQEAVDFTTHGNGVRLHFATAQPCDGDAVIGADGIHSALRGRILDGMRPRYTGNTAWRVMVEATPNLLRLVPDAATAWTGPGRHAVTYFLAGRRAVNFVGVLEASEPAPEGWERTGEIDRVRAAFADFAAPVRAVLDQAGTVRLWGLYDRATPTRLGGARVTLIGDAACPMPPFMAQGAGLAIEAAWMAVWSLSATGRFGAHEAVVLRRSGRMLGAARRNGDLFHGRGPAAGFGHAPVRLAAGLAPQLIRSRFDWVYGFDATRGRPLGPA
jgi:salicylate hydroxylase